MLIIIMLDLSKTFKKIALFNWYVLVIAVLLVSLPNGIQVVLRIKVLVGQP